MTYPLATLAPTIDSTGISAPTYLDTIESLKESFRQIYGDDIYISSDSQDGQWIAIIAKAVFDSNQAAIAIFQSFSPTFAQGTQLSSLVKINGIARNIRGFSSAVGDVVGVAGTIITNGIVQDSDGNDWTMPASVTIPIGGSISVSVVCLTAGAVIAPIGTINKIKNPQLGWQSFVSTVDATIGAPVESDYNLKQRQKVSTGLPSQTVLSGILASVANIAGVTRFAAYENFTGSTDANGIPPHSFSIVVLGGDVNSVANAIALKKMPGSQTYGTTSVGVVDSNGMPSTINFYELTKQNIYFAITVKALTGYTSDIGVLIKQSLYNFINNLSIGEDVYYSQAMAAAQIVGVESGQTFYITTFNLGTAPAPSGTSNITIAFNVAAVVDSLSDIAITVT